MQIEDQYFEALDIPLLRGRSFDAADLEEGAHVVAVNQSFVDRYWPRAKTRSAAACATAGSRPATGAAAALAHHRRRGRRRPPSGLDRGVTAGALRSLRQLTGRGMTVVIETAGDPAALAAVARETVSKIDADQPVYNARTIDEIVEREAAGFRAIAQILGTIGFGALALAAVGIYGVITWSMSQRRQEIGIRRAVGASGRDIVWLTLRQGLTPVAVGLVVGTALSVGFALALRGLMFGIAPAAPESYLLSAAGLLLVATAASLVPAAKGDAARSVGRASHE